MQPASDDLFEAVPVSDLVNKVANAGAELQKPISLAEPVALPKPMGQMSLF